MKKEEFVIDIDTISKTTDVDTKKLIEILTSGQPYEFQRDSRGCYNIILK
jgi:hypothetical protein